MTPILNLLALGLVFAGGLWALLMVTGFLADAANRRFTPGVCAMWFLCSLSYQCGQHKDDAEAWAYSVAGLLATAGAIAMLGACVEGLRALRGTLRVPR